MDGISAAASLVALVQAAGMLLQVGKAFHETFITKDNDNRAEDAATQVASIGEFIQKIVLFQNVQLTMPSKVANLEPLSAYCSVTTSPTVHESSVAGASVQPDLDPILEQCKGQLYRLEKKVQKMILPEGVSKMKRFYKAVRLRLNESEFAQIESTITIMLQQLDVFISMALLDLSQQSYIASQVRHDELLHRQDTLETQIQSASQQGMDQQVSLLLELQRSMEDHQMKVDAQIAAFEQGNQMILNSFEKLAISPRLDRSTSGLSGTTAASEMEVVGEEDLIAPIAPALMRHPGFGFRDDCLSEPKIAKSVLDRIDTWLNPADGQHGSVLCFRADGHEEVMHDLCNRVVQEIAGSGRRLLCYNGSPRDGPPPAAGWYTMTHVIWWLSGQLLMPVPHRDGHMPSHGYIPSIKAVVRQLDKFDDSTTYIVLYLLTRSCITESDRRLYKLLLEQLNDTLSTHNIRLLVFSDGVDDVAFKIFDPHPFIPYSGDELQIYLSEWEPKTLIDEGEDHNEDSGGDTMSED